MVPPGLLPCLPVDTPDQCFNSIDFGPLQHSLKCALNIEEYNSIWFDTNSVPPSYHTQCSTTHQPKPMIEETKQTQFPSIQSLSDSLDPPASVTSPPPTSSSSPKPNQPPQQIQASSKDNLFFIRYVWEGTAQPHWFLVQVTNPHPTKHGHIFLVSTSSSNTPTIPPKGTLIAAFGLNGTAYY